MKIIRYERHNKENKNDNIYSTTNLNKIYHKIEKHKYATNQIISPKTVNPVAEM